MRNFMVNRLQNQKQRYIKEVKSRSSSYQLKRELMKANYVESAGRNLAIDNTLQKQLTAFNFNSTQEYKSSRTQS